MKIGYITNATVRGGVGNRAGQMRKVLGEKYPESMDEIVINGEEGKMLIKGGHEQVLIRRWPGVLGSKSVNWARLIRRIKPEYDLVHATNQSLSLAAKRFARSIVTVHDIIEVKEPQDKRAAWLNKYLYGGIMEASQIICVSEFTADETADFYGLERDKIEVIYNGVDREMFYPITEFSETVVGLEWRRKLKIEEKTKILLYVGSEHPRKNVEAVIEVLARVVEKYPDTVLIKVGGAGILSGRERMLKTIDKHGARDKVRFIKDISSEQLNELYNLSEALIFPSRYEGFGLPPLEAMAAGTPVITTDAAALPEVMGDNGKYGEKGGFIYDPDDVEGMAGAVIKVWESDSEVTEIVEAGRRRAEEFSWEKSGEKLVQVYNKMLI